MTVALLALFVALGGVGVAATGGTFILGQSNAAENQTGLSASVAGKTLQVTNPSTASGATALGLSVASGHAPLTVTSAVKVANLNVDKLDGFDSLYFLPKSGKAANSDLLDGIDASGFVPTAALTRVGPVTMPGTLSTTFKTLATIGQLRFELSCTADAGFNAAILSVRSSAAHAAYADVTQGATDPRQFLEVDMSADTRYSLAGTAAPGFQSASGQALSADGHSVSFDLYAGQDVGVSTDHSCVGGGTFLVK